MENRKSLEYYVLDVFSDKSYRGNPLAVVFTEGNLALDDYQNIAKEFGYSETSFVCYSEDNGALDVRSFTPTGVEVGAGGGHNLLGAVAAALLNGMQIFQQQEEGKRFVTMKNTHLQLEAIADNSSKTAVVQMQQKPAIARQSVPANLIAKALGLKTDDLRIDNLLPTTVETEVAHTMVPIKSLQLLNNCIPDNERLIEISKQYAFEGFYCFAFAEPDEEHLVEARFFNPLIGIDEDAATGTAAGPLIGFLAKNNYVELNKKYKILQGVKLNQPSLIETMVRTDDILVGGISIITMQGALYL